MDSSAGPPRIGTGRGALSLVLAAPFLVAAPLLSGWPFLAALAIGGMFLQSTLPVNVTFGQMLAPVSAATVSSLMMGFAWGTGGITALFVGMLADRIGIRDTLLGLACVPVLAAAVALALPSGRSLRMPSEQRFIVAETPEITE